MEKERSSRVIAVFALLIAVAGLSLGFAALTRDLNISLQADVNPENNLQVAFSTSEDEQVAGTVVGQGTNGASSGDATISASEPTKITGLKANFTKPGQVVTYEFYVHNIGAFDAYLTGVTFENATGEAQPKKCVPGTNTTESYVNNVCDDITVKVNVGGYEAEGSVANIPDQLLSKTATDTLTTNEKVVVTITYDETGDVADGDFTVNFGDLVLTYSSINPGSTASN